MDLISKLEKLCRIFLIKIEFLPNKGFERKPQEQSLTNGSSLKIEADDVRFVWPIPKHELESPGSQIQPNESNK